MYNCILYTHFFKDVSVYHFMANFQKQLFSKFVLREMTILISSYIIFYVEPKECMLHFKNAVHLRRYLKS